MRSAGASRVEGRIEAGGAGAGGRRGKAPLASCADRRRARGRGFSQPTDDAGRCTSRGGGLLPAVLPVHCTGAALISGSDSTPARRARRRRRTEGVARKGRPKRAATCWRRCLCRLPRAAAGPAGEACASSFPLRPNAHSSPAATSRAPASAAAAPTMSTIAHGRAGSCDGEEHAVAPPREAPDPACLPVYCSHPGSCSISSALPVCLRRARRISTANVVSGLRQVCCYDGDCRC